MPMWPSRPPDAGDPPPVAPMRRGPGRGFTLIEILIATVVLAFAMIPVSGLMTTGLVRTDVNVGYTAAVELSSGIMNHILSEDTPFSMLPVSPATTAYPARGSALAPATGNVAADPALDRLFPAPEWSVDAGNGTRDITMNGITYHVMMWVGVYPQANQLQFGFYESPVLGFHLGTNPAEFEKVKTLLASDYAAGFAPWAPGSVAATPADVFPSQAASRIVSHPWCRTEVIQDQTALSEGTAGAFANFAKVVLRVSWGEDLRLGRGGAKDFWLVSFKADLQE